MSGRSTGSFCPISSRRRPLRYTQYPIKRNSPSPWSVMIRWWYNLDSKILSLNMVSVTSPVKNSQTSQIQPCSHVFPAWPGLPRRTRPWCYLRTYWGVSFCPPTVCPSGRLDHPTCLQLLCPYSVLLQTWSHFWQLVAENPTGTHRKPLPFSIPLSQVLAPLFCSKSHLNHGKKWDAMALELFSITELEVCEAA